MGFGLIGYLVEVQIYNVFQLEAWFIYFIVIYYNVICRQCLKVIKNFDFSIFKSIEEKRWFLVWYILEVDWYEKVL